uniref:Uncharacterized protein n=1 Tax=Nelumbo nucifera TaxID=4432 RepID=A0A822Z6Q3_NELNU|nr:TPA_asm: hypothetical protein HUJ06_013392 [Nelumbo nucifera]
MREEGKKKKIKEREREREAGDGEELVVRVSPVGGCHSSLLRGSEEGDGLQ